MSPHDDTQPTAQTGPAAAPATTASATAAMDEGAVRALAERLYADPGLGPGYMLREDCEHLARRVLVALGAEVQHKYGVRAENGSAGYASEDVARSAVTEGYTLGSERSPIVAGLSRVVVTFEPLHGAWTDLAPTPHPTPHPAEAHSDAPAEGSTA